MGEETSELVERYKGYTVEMKELPSKRWFGCIVQGIIYHHTLPKSEGIPSLVLAARAWIDNRVQEEMNKRDSTEDDRSDTDEHDDSGGVPISEDDDGSPDEGQEELALR